jgi:hypothetical protein
VWYVRTGLLTPDLLYIETADERQRLTSLIYKHCASRLITSSVSLLGNVKMYFLGSSLMRGMRFEMRRQKSIEHPIGGSLRECLHKHGQLRALSGFADQHINGLKTCLYLVLSHAVTDLSARLAISRAKDILACYVCIIE